MTSVIVYRRVRTTVDTSGHPHITLNLSHFRSHISAHALPDGRLSKGHRSHHRRAMCETTHSLRGPAVPRPRASDPKRVWKPFRCRSVQAHARHLKSNSAVGSQPLKSSSSCSSPPPPTLSRHLPIPDASVFAPRAYLCKPFASCQGSSMVSSSITPNPGLSKEGAFSTVEAAIASTSLSAAALAAAF